MAGRRLRRLERVASSRAGGWYFLNVANRIDKRLLPATNGRLTSAPGRQLLVIEVIGAKSGQPRRVPLQYITDGRDIVLIASKAGASKHPAWYHNLRANPEATVWAKGRSGRYRASVVEGPDYDRLWARAVEYYSGYDVYRERAGERRIPVVRLTPA
jgi:deazaflavin-dependent oxidoreductase (nitroreductase family)